MSENDLENQLEKLRQTLSDEKFIKILLSYLDQNPSMDERDIYQAWLQAYGYKDKRVTDYWKKLLSDNDKWQQERAVHNLFGLCETGNTSACEILREFLGEEPSPEAVKRRLFRRLGLE
jgi:HEAT repeat protein